MDDDDFNLASDHLVRMRLRGFSEARLVADDPACSAEDVRQVVLKHARDIERYIDRMTPTHKIEGE